VTPINLMHVIPAEGVDADGRRGRHGRNNGTGIATAALQLADAFGEPCDLVLVAVPPGHGAKYVTEQILADHRAPL
jgi:hypothetical protein